MSLDCWLAPRNPHISGPPPTKRSRIDTSDEVPPHEPTGGLCSVVSRKPSPNSTNCGAFSAQQHAFPRFLRSTNHSTEPPEYTVGRRSLFGWSASDRFHGDEHITTVECVPGAPMAVLGLDNGEVDVIECSTNPDLGVRAREVGTCRLSKVVPPGWPIVDIAAIDSSTVVCTSKRGPAILDPNTGQVSADFFQYDSGEITKLAVNEQARLAFGGSHGSIGLLDIRDPHSYSELVHDAHSVRTGPRANRRRPDISALAWSGPHTLASASQSDESVKFWDVRYTRKAPMMSTVSRVSDSAVRSSGINCLRAANSVDGSVWGMARSGSVIRLNPLCEQPEYRLVSPALKLSSPYQNLDVIPGGSQLASHYNDLTNRNKGPRYPLIACSSDNGVALITEPSQQAYNLEVDATYASRLAVKATPSFLPPNVTALKWHPHTQELIAVVANRGWEIWAHNDPSKSYAKPIPVKIASVAAWP